ncbi:MAG TPA: Uma2 family endonuclease [Acidobacteriaceae bacterium]
MEATIALVPVEEYLRTSYEPDIDYVDGHLHDRNVGENNHSNLQGELATILRSHGKAWNVYAYIASRVQVSAKRYRVPDVCVMPRTWKKTPIIHEAPMLCFEVLSTEDTFSRTQVKCRDYLQMGVPEVWIFDPEERTAFILRGETMTAHREGTLRLTGTEVQINLGDLFAVLDEE